jgi:formate/nitrite transporter FocA (FNT family)
MLAIWGPTVLFFSQGYEHAVVNMFAIPMGMLLGANVSLSTWWFWNQIPVTLGNLLGGMLFTGLAIYYTHGPATAPGTSVELASQQRSSADPAGYPAPF